MITKEEINKLADLARISLNDEEKENLLKDIGGILEYVGQIKKAGDYKGKTRELAVKNVMREDVLTNQSCEYTETLVNAAPKNERRYVKVKKILQ